MGINKLNRTKRKMKYKYYIAFLLVFVCILSACKKGLPTWDADYVFPIAHGSIKIQDLVKDNIEEASDKTLIFSLSDTLFQLRLDTLLKTADTSLVDSFAWTFGAFNLFPDQQIFGGTKESVYKVKDIELKKIIIESGKIYFEMYNTIDEKLLVHYELPKATKNGQIISIDRLVEAANGNTPGYLKDSIDLSGYTIDFTGQNGTKTNVLLSSYSIKVDPNGAQVTIQMGDYAKIVTSIQDLVPFYGSGFLGSNAQSYASAQYLDVFKNLSGMIDLEEVAIDLVVENGLGVDARLTFNQLQSKNTKTATQKFLTGSLLNNPININRAQDEVPGQGPVHYSSYLLSLNKNNSNIDELLEILPDSLRYNIEFALNPLGNISNGTDFLYLNETVNILLDAKIPLHFNASGFTLTDTINLELTDNNRETLDNTQSATIHFFASNAFPVEANLSLYFMGENNERIGVLSEQAVLSAANGTQATDSRIDFVLDASKIDHLRQATAIYLVAAFNTANYPQKIVLRSDQILDVQFTLDVSQRIP